MNCNVIGRFANVRLQKEKQKKGQEKIAFVSSTERQSNHVKDTQLIIHAYPK